MLKLKDLTRYRENNRIEAKKARGGLPESIWESYSAFANTLGGVILLGVVERKDYTLYPVGLEAAQEMVDEFWRLLPKMANRNILRKTDVKIETVKEKEIIVISVPRARRSQKPIYIGSSPYAGTYKRDGEGDYRCTKEEVDKLVEASKTIDFDMQSLPYREGMLKDESVAAYNERTNSQLKFGESIDVGTLLLLGKRDEVRKVAPNFFAKYTFTDDKQEEYVEFDNIFDFFQYVGTDAHTIAVATVPVTDDLLVEAMLNGILNADYEAGGVECRATRRSFEIKNNGNFCVDKSLALSGGISEIRNERLNELFTGIVGERKGKGLSTIFWYWDSLSLVTPQIEESHSPDMITFKLDLRIKPGVTFQSGVIYEQWLIGLLTDWPRKRLGGLYQAYGIPKAYCEELLNKLIDRNIVVKEGRYYKLKR